MNFTNKLRVNIRLLCDISRSLFYNFYLHVSYCFVVTYHSYTHIMFTFQGLVHCSDISNVPISAADIGKLYKMGQVTLFLGLKIINLVN